MTITATRLFGQEPIVDIDAQEDDFFGAIKLANGTYKTTTRNRLSDLNAALIRTIRAQQRLPERVLDIGVSSGISTVELLGDLSAAGFASRIVGCDATLDAFIDRPVPGVRVLVEPNGHPLQYDVFGFAFRPWFMPRDYYSGAFLPVSAMNSLARFWYRNMAAANPAERPAPRAARPVRLLTREAARSSIEFCEDDILQPPPAQFQSAFDVVRAANLINRTYFDDTAIRQIIRRIRLRIAGIGSLVAVCRTHADRSNHGSIFRLESSGQFSVVEHVGQGSEVEEFFVEAPQDRNAAA